MENHIEIHETSSTPLRALQPGNTRQKPGATFAHTAWIELAVFLALFSCLGLLLSQIFRYRDIGGGAGFDTFYALEKNSVDVMFFGSSHAHCSFDTRKLWDDAGIASVSLTAGAQSIDGTYLFIKEALKYQHPKVIFVETLEAAGNSAPDTAALYRSDLSSRWSPDQTALVLDQTKHYNLEEDTRNGLLFRFPILHARYTELNQDDFHNAAPWRMGYIGSQDVQAASPPQLTEEAGQIGAVGEEYLRKIMQLCEYKEVPVVFICAPFPATKEQCMEQNAIGDFVTQNGGTFLNGNDLAQEMGLDFSTDIRDGDHLNDAGAAKFTQYVEDYLQNHYNMEDHRGDGAYARWDQNSRYLNLDRQAQYALQGAADLNAYLISLVPYENELTMVLSLNGNYLALGEDALLPGLQALGIGQDVARAGGSLILQKGKVVYCSSQTEGASETDAVTMQADVNATYSFTLTSSGEQARQLTIQRRALQAQDTAGHNDIGAATTYTGLYLDETDYGGTLNGVDVLVYDEDLDFLVDAVHVNMFEGTTPVHADSASER